MWRVGCSPGSKVTMADGGIADPLTDIRTDNKFMKGLAGQSIKVGEAVFFVLVRKVTDDKVLKGLEGMGEGGSRPRATIPARSSCATRPQPGGGPAGAAGGKSRAPEEPCLRISR